MKVVVNALAVLIVLVCVPFMQVGAQTGATITLLDRDDKPVTSIVDGNQVSLKIELNMAVTVDARVDFLLAGADAPVASCTIPSGRRDCLTASFSALGWFWNPDGSPQPQREVSAWVDGQQAGGSLSVTVRPRPVVMVHGFNSNFHTWDTYLGPQGYLAAIGVQGYAVGDGQVEGVLDTGSLTNPAAQTNTIAENAAIVGEYIDNVQRATGAEKVDLLVHSMGGMISRYYIDRVMTDVDVAQLIILGTPMAGSDCARLPAALGILLPATIEIQPSYMVGIFNQQIYKRHGIPFHALAGTKLNDAVQSPCTPVPSDIVVTVDSVKAIPMPVQEISLLHMDLNIVQVVFDEFVKPLLQTPPGKFEVAVDPPAGSNVPVGGQFTRVYTGHVNPGETQEVVINIDPGVTVANFAMYDSTRSLTTTVTGASGRQIELSAEANGLIRIEDPSTLVYLGYGFKQPKPGKWVISVEPTGTTPATGADFAVTAQFSGGAALAAGTDTLIPELGQPVTVSASLTNAGVPLALTSAQVRLTQPDGRVDVLDMNIEGNTASLKVQPKQDGIYGLEVNVASKTTDGFDIDRAASLAFVVQPSGQEVVGRQTILVIGVIGLVALAALVIVRRRMKKKRAA